MLVLLIIFMVAAPMIQRGVDVNLPVARNAQQMTGDRVEITVPIAYRQNQASSSSGASPCARRCCRSASGRKWRRRPRRTSSSAAIGGVNLGELMEVFSMLKAAGVEHVGIETSAPSER